MNCSSYGQAGAGCRTGYLEWEEGTSTVLWR